MENYDDLTTHPLKVITHLNGELKDCLVTIQKLKQENRKLKDKIEMYEEVNKGE